MDPFLATRYLTDPLYLGGSGLSWLMTIFTARRAVQAGRQDVARWAMAGGMLTSALGQSMLIVPVATTVTRITGMPNLYLLISYLCTTGLAWCAVAMNMYWVRPTPDLAWRSSQRWAVFYGLCGLGFVVLFALGNQPTDHYFLSPHAADPYVTAFLSLYVLVLCSFLVVGAAIAVRNSRLTTKPWMKWCTRLMAAGGVLGCGDGVTKMTYIAINLERDQPVGGEVLVAAGFIFGASALLVLGPLLPVFGPGVAARLARTGVADRLARASDWVDAYRTHRVLFPLWRVLTEAMPDVVFPGSAPKNRWQAVWSPRDLLVRAHRRKIEILGAALDLAPYAEYDFVQAAHAEADAKGLTGLRKHAVVEASRLHAGLAGLAAGRLAEKHAQPVLAGNQLDPNTESRRMRLVAKAFRGLGRAPHPEGSWGNLDEAMSR